MDFLNFAFERIAEFYEMVVANITLDGIIKFSILYFFIIWGAFIIWVVKDITNRTTNILIQVLSILIVILFTPIFGLPIYLLIRPRTTIFEKYYEEQEEAQIEEENEENIEKIPQIKEEEKEIILCPKCNKHIEENFLFCPYCKEKLTTKCEKCGKTIKTFWSNCPFCGEDEHKENEAKIEKTKEIKEEKVKIKIEKKDKKTDSVNEETKENENS